MHRFFIPEDALRPETVRLPDDVAHQVARVLRLRPGARVVLFCGDGCESEAILEDVGPRAVTARRLETRTPAVELPCRLQVAVAVLKGEKLDWVVQKLTELGACRISLVRTERTVVTAGEERWSRRRERYERIAREAAEQCGRVRLPQLDEPRPLADLLAEETEAVRVLLDPTAGPTLLGRLAPCPGAVQLLIGPEGGFTEAETSAARAAGAVGVRLGARILRAETAAIAAATLVAAAADRE